jgi:DNA-directed RNA polymerase specialized sigma24 family protein
MSNGRDSVELSAKPPGLFATTHWSVVLSVGQRDSSQAAEALEQLCRTYWYPIYAYVRRRGYGPADAEDLTQGFLLQLLQRRSIKRADPGKGRFRSFLLGGLKYFLADQRERARAQKRGGGLPLEWLDAPAAERRYNFEPADNRSPDKLYESRWALALLDSVLTRLEMEYHDAGKSELFERLRLFLAGDHGDMTYGLAAAELGVSKEALKKAAQRLRHRYYDLFRQEIAHTVSSPAEVEGEMRHLCAVISG